MESYPPNSAPEQPADSSTSILVVDADGGFAALLRESLERNGYRVAVAASGAEAAQALSALRFDLAVVDMGLAGSDGAPIARSLRQQQPGLRLVVVPLAGEGVPEELAGLDVQGVLPKPFFLPDLAGRIADALARPLHADGRNLGLAAPVGDSATAPSASVEEEATPAMVQAMSALAEDTGIEVVILARQAQLLAHAGRPSREQAGRIAQAVAAGWHTSAPATRVSGREQLRFEPSIEGGEYVFYSLAVAEPDVILSLALRPGVALGMARQRARQVAIRLRELMSEARDAENERTGPD